MSKRIPYATDVAHCGGEDCAIRENCVRYRLRKELCKKAVNGFLPPNICPPHVDEQYDFETEDCEMFKPIE